MDLTQEGLDNVIDSAREVLGAEDRTLRLLFVPVFNYPNKLDADSIYHISNDWCTALLEADPRIAIHRLMPKATRDKFTKFGYTPRKLHDRLHDTRVKMFGHYGMEENHVPWEDVMDFHPVLGRRPVQGVICTSATKTAHMAPIFKLAPGAMAPVTMFNFELLIRSAEGSNEVSNINEADLMLQVAGELAGVSLFESPKCKRMALATASTIVLPSRVRQIDRNSEMVFSGYPQGSAYEQEEKESELTWCIRGRITPSKRIDKIVECLGRVYASGVPMKVLLTTGGNMAKVTRVCGSAILEAGNVEVIFCKTAGEAAERMRKCHAFLFWSSHELFAVSVWEMLASGLIGVFKREDWLVGLLPEDYPYVFDTEMEAYTLVRYISTNYQEAKARVAHIPGWVRETYAYDRTTVASAKMLRAHVCIEDVRDWVLDTFKASTQKEMTLQQAELCVAGAARMGKSVIPRLSPSSFSGKGVGASEIVSGLLSAGYRDDLTMDHAIYRR